MKIHVVTAHLHINLQVSSSELNMVDAQIADLFSAVLSYVYIIPGPSH